MDVKNIVIRVDASIRMGTGHVMRCKTLADELRERGAEIRFVCREHQGDLIPLLRDAGYTVLVLPTFPCSNVTNSGTESYDAWLGVAQSVDAAQTLEVIGDFMPDWLIVDHYRLDIAWERLIRSKVRKILVVDDLANRIHDCDMLLDQNAYENSASRYHGKTPPPCIKLLGPRYALLRREFQVAKRQLRRQQGAIKRVLVAFGGADAIETTNVLNVLERPNFSSIDVDVVIGLGHPNKNEISSQCSRHSNWRLHCGTKEMAMLMARADVAIGAGGITTWERIYLGLPTFVKVVAANQAEAMDYLACVGQIKIWRDAEELAALLAAHLTSGIALPPFEVNFGTNEVAEQILPYILPKVKPHQPDTP
jgi:UDP-2,4-diacetamido-2,4,6-trideoxy-beta-L-altropyranose hydrolase